MQKKHFDVLLLSVLAPGPRGRGAADKRQNQEQAGCAGLTLSWAEADGQGEHSQPLTTLLKDQFTVG